MLFKKVAIDPDAFDGTLERFRYLIGGLKPGSGRLGAQYPRRWLRQIAGLGPNASPMQKKCAEALLIQARRSIYRTGVAYDQDKDWVENAIQRAESGQIDAVILEEGEPFQGCLSAGLDWLELPHSPWLVENSIVTQCSRDNILRYVKRILEVSVVVKIIDPYFTPQSAASRRTMQTIIASLGDRCERIEFHFKDLDVLSEAQFRPFAEQIDKSGKDIQVSFGRWNLPEMHDRYLITENAGISSGYGFSDRPNRDTTLSRMSENDRKTLFQRFHEDSDDECLHHIMTF